MSKLVSSDIVALNASYAARVLFGGESTLEDHSLSNAGMRFVKFTIATPVFKDPLTLGDSIQL